MPATGQERSNVISKICFLRKLSYFHEMILIEGNKAEVETRLWLSVNIQWFSVLLWGKCQQSDGDAVAGYCLSISLEAVQLSVDSASLKHWGKMSWV